MTPAGGVTCDDPGVVTVAGVKFPRDPLLNPLPESERFDVLRSVSVAINSTEILADFTLGKNEWAVINKLGQEILDSPAGREAEGFANVTWAIKVNGIPVQFYGALRDQIGEGSQLTEIFVFVNIAGARVTFEVTSPSTSPNIYLCFGRFRGWTIPLPVRS